MPLKRNSVSVSDVFEESPSQIVNEMQRCPTSDIEQNTTEPKSAVELNFETLPSNPYSTAKNNK